MTYKYLKGIYNYKESTTIDNIAYSLYMGDNYNHGDSFYEQDYFVENKELSGDYYKKALNIIRTEKINKINENIFRNTL